MNYEWSAYSSQTAAEAPVDIRAAFVRKVYQLFFVSVLVTVAAGAICAQPAIAPVLFGLWPILMIATFVLGIIMAFTRRTTGLNLAVFMAFAACMGAMLGPILLMVGQSQPGVPEAAAILSIAVFGALSLYAITSRKDFSYLGGFLFAALIGLIVAGIVLIFVHAALASIIYSLFGILIFSGFILYDTSQIIHRLTPDQAIVGAIELYLDFINLFMFILRLLSDLNRRS